MVHKVDGWLKCRTSWARFCLMCANIPKENTIKNIPFLYFCKESCFYTIAKNREIEFNFWLRFFFIIFQIASLNFVLKGNLKLLIMCQTIMIYQTVASVIMCHVGLLEFPKTISWHHCRQCNYKMSGNVFHANRIWYQWLQELLNILRLFWKWS